MRELKSENRHLKKRLGINDKKIKRYEEEEDEEATTTQFEERSEEVASEEEPRCPKCKGQIISTDLGSRLLLICQDCGSRKTIKK